MRHWTVVDESSFRAGFCCLAVREVDTARLICDLADEPLDYPDCVERSHREAKLIAKAPELLAMLRRMVYAAEAKKEPKYAGTALYRDAVRDTYALLDQLEEVDDDE